MEPMPLFLLPFVVLGSQYPLPWLLVYEWTQVCTIPLLLSNQVSEARNLKREKNNPPSWLEAKTLPLSGLP